VLANPNVQTERGDSLKYVPLSPTEPLRYLSFGVTLRERFESKDAAPLFGTAQHGSEDYLLHRLELHMDAHFWKQTRLFVQLENAVVPGLEHPSSVDANKLDLRLAFLDTHGELWGGRYEVRVGRQEFAFDLQRFASVRDAPNVRQAFDGVKAQFDLGDWRMSALASRPVQYRNNSAFDDFSDQHFKFSGIRVERRPQDGIQGSVTLSDYRRDNAVSLAASGPERRRNLDFHSSGNSGGFDWDVEGMVQRGSVSREHIRAWGTGALAGYTIAALGWQPRAGLQLDTASGTRDLTGGQIGTFNPLFPNGYYLTLSGYTGYSNFIHFKQSLTISPAPALKMLVAVGELWRKTIQDAVYVFPATPITGTAGLPGGYTATYYQVRGDWAISRNFALALEANHYVVGSAIRLAGGHDSDYVGLEVRWGW
jgi:hypothetical protein